ncbi:MAG: hypothetical protein ACRDZO_05120 [Egibacteraceae bacterium]
MSTTPQTETRRSARPREIQVKVDYLPAAAPFHDRFAPDATAESVRTAAMAFFGVQDRQERDTYQYFLECGGNRITDTGQPISHLVEHGHQLHCHLVEQITPGAV